MKFNLFNRYSPRVKIMAAALIIAVIVTIWYLLSGQGTLDQNLVQLQSPNSNVQNVQVEDQPQGAKQITINCADGSSYDVYLPPGEKDSSAVKNNLCN